MRIKSAHAALLTLAGCAPAFAWELSPRLELEVRGFPGVRSGEPLTGSVAGVLEGFHDFSGSERRRFNFDVFARADSQDASRTHADARDLYYQYIGRDFELRLGNRRVFWGVTESRHLVDIINQSDLAEDLDTEAKLGQPMFNLAVIRDTGALDIYLMPYQRARTFPGVDGYPQLPFPVAVHEAQYESRQGQHHLDFAARYATSWGGFDLGVAVFNGTAREPLLRPCLRRGSGYVDTDNGPNCDIVAAAEASAPQSPLPDDLTPLLQALGLFPSDDEVRAEIEADVRRNLVLVPAYRRLRQISLDLQYVNESLALKLETLLREDSTGRSTAAVAGVEYNLGDVGATGVDIGLLAEYLYDEKRDGLNARFTDDLFLGARVGLNDEAGTELLAGVIVNRPDFRQYAFQLEASRRLTDAARLSLDARGFADSPADSPEAFLDGQSLVRLTLEWFF